MRKWAGHPSSLLRPGATLRAFLKAFTAKGDIKRWNNGQKAHVAEKLAGLGLRRRAVLAAGAQMGWEHSP